MTKQLLLLSIVCLLVLSACTINIIQPTPAPTATQIAKQVPAPNQAPALKSNPTTERMVEVLTNYDFGPTDEQVCNPKPCTRYGNDEVKLNAIVAENGEFIFATYIGLGADTDKQAEAFVQIIGDLYGSSMLDWVNQNTDKIKGGGSFEGQVNGLTVIISVIDGEKNTHIFVFHVIPQKPLANGKQG